MRELVKCRPSRKSFLSIITATMLALPSLGTAGPNEAPTDLVLTTNWAEHTVSLVNLALGEEKGRIDVGAKPYDIKVEHTGRFAYTTLSGGSEISVIDIQANLESHRISVGEGPRDLMLSKDSTKAYVANAGSGTVSVVDLVAEKEIAQIPVGTIPYGIDITADEKMAVVTNWGAGTVSFLDLETNEEIKQISIGTLPYTVGISEQLNLAFVTNFGDNQIGVIDLNTLEVVQKIDTDRSPWGLAVSPDGMKVAVANFYTGGITVVRLNGATSEEALANLEVETFYPNPAQADRAKLLLAKSNESNGDTSTTDPRVPGDGPSPSSVRSKNVAMSDTGKVVFTDLANNAVGVLDTNTNQFSEFIAVGKAPYGLAFIEHEKRADLK